MVSFWPFGVQEDAASFERTLSTLSAKIARATAQNDKLRQRSRRARVMWTLYAGFAYILAALLLVLVTGWKRWGPIEISVVSGGPVTIYVVRKLITTYYDYRITNMQAYLKRLIEERDTAIERLKSAAIKYNTTQKLIEKYGSSPGVKPTPSPSSKEDKRTPQKATQPQGPRTGIAPPATANIARPKANSRPTTPLTERLAPMPPPVPSPYTSRPTTAASEGPGAEFAPNAFEPEELRRQYSASAAVSYTQSHWYDRIMDALLGEDETQPKNRLALICAQCRLINGQAPPGVRSLDDVGRWRCTECRAWNGKEKVKEDDVAELVRGIKEEGVGQDYMESAEDTGEDSDTVNLETESPAAVGPPSRSLRSRSKKARR
ncbi:hypothetical protein M011DRAFT_406593 [Sporormia fimetaria CBS 119925]|uniref:Endoplasmic reticulum junction formation protein lunapark n=1 Tax=Sporormia fimetaria CBS 119925 TaxID=1340428 RepID=A0A6A6V8K0_9PLEO|nr:hypothetical protein M011DRAFT_406593 [Sporormia fimetaria CBS 119925]